MMRRLNTLIVTKISFSQQESNSSMKRRDTNHLKDARTVGVRKKPKREPVASVDIDKIRHALIRTEKHPCINIFKVILFQAIFFGSVL